MRMFLPTEEQQSIIECSSDLVVIARPGSGKTFVVSEKVRSILETLPGYKGVIAISYTNKASDELKVRCQQGAVDIKGSFFGTIDKFCDSEIIVPFLPHLWGKPSNEIRIELIRDLPPDEKDCFGFVKANQLSLEELEEHLELLKFYYAKGQLLLETNGALALYALRNSEACRRYLCARYTHLFVDEYQDSGLEQHNIFLELAGLGMTTIAVGDVDQSIFGFSNKSPAYLVDLTRRPEFKTFSLNRNHRCHNSIINYSLRLLDPNAELLRAEENRVYQKHVQGDQREVAEWVSDSIENIMDSFNVQKPSDVSILVRGNHTIDLVDAGLKVKHRCFRRIPLEEDFSLWAKLFCALLTYRSDDAATAEEIIRDFSHGMLPRRDVVKTRRLISRMRKAKIEAFAEQAVSCAEILLPNARVDRAVELLEKTVVDPHLLDTFAAAADDEVRVMTLHKAKGLEFDLVFHLDLYEWVLPAKGPGANDDWDSCEYADYAQDLNLHYMGVTRARKACFLCTSSHRINARGQVKRGAPSEFFSINNVEKLRNNSSW